MRKISSILMAALLGALCLTGCGGNDKAADTDKNVSSAAVSSPAADESTTVEPEQTEDTGSAFRKASRQDQGEKLWHHFGRVRCGRGSNHSDKLCGACKGWFL